MYQTKTDFNSTCFTDKDTKHFDGWKMSGSKRTMSRQQNSRMIPLGIEEGSSRFAHDRSELVANNAITRAERSRRRKGIRTEMPISMSQSALREAIYIERYHHAKYGFERKVSLSPKAANVASVSTRGAKPDYYSARRIQIISKRDFLLPRIEGFGMI